MAATARWCVGGLALAPLFVIAQVGPYNQTPRDRAEKSQDRQQIVQGAGQQQADAAQLSQLKSLQASYAPAAGAQDPAAVGALDRQMLAALDAEIAESTQETGQKSVEQAQNRSESRSNRRETRSDVGQGTPVRAGDDALDRTRDVANRADDAADTKGEAARLQQVQQLRATYASLAGRVDEASLTRKSAAIGELVALSEQELAANAQEGKEDTRELREDRREKREDQRQRW
jgi:hypothetical protein